MKAEELVRAGRLEEALADVQNAVKAKPEEARLRIFLFQVQCLMGKWEKALVQLQVLADLNAETFLLSRVFQPVIQCEMLREKIFAGQRSPIIFGEPMPWVGRLVQANQHIAHGNYLAAQALREQAFEEAPATVGQINEQSFEWIADADTRLGPMLEVILEGRYYWAPFCRIKQIEMEPPKDLRDLVWIPARFQWANQGQATGHIPVRYPGSTRPEDGPLRLARQTAWTEHDGGHSLGRGQRLLATDQAEYPLLECRRINLSPLASCPD